MHPIHRLITILATTVLIAIGSPIFAGPPLVCHPIDIGTAESLPFANPPSDVDHNYDTRNLVTDTLKRLSPDTPVLVRMETIRRAVMYVQRNSVLAGDLLIA